MVSEQGLAMMANLSGSSKSFVEFGERKIEGFCFVEFEGQLQNRASCFTGYEDRPLRRLEPIDFPSAHRTVCENFKLQN